ncbi:chitobiase/beta-hexosaminidase C-terminal domain-containing protein [Georgenia satyanarayanai]|uniref:chitobiase/beta-hexosaminidase C-terminal domain-containing protein n=1 Tax=Georgenia satyanarayanai TaxID=860221 RepID=UPI00203D87B4|nr:chitobiase/beta-hexosaminidase C-terminal domain-containing protein [Georgenia satyanarayanai]MCM3659510.1 chitobiase/beta-hexosaminidase C-terminal domain-containing protein [Georgenia satyanarayanai]
MTIRARQRTRVARTAVLTGALLLAPGLAATVPAAAEDVPAAVVEDVVVATHTGDLPDLPTEVEVRTVGGDVVAAPVEWLTEGLTFARHYSTVVVPGMVDDILPVTARVPVVPDDTVYFIDSGMEASTPEFEATAQLTELHNAVADQQAQDGGWGFVNDGGSYVAKRAGQLADRDETGLYALGNGSSSRPIVYRLPLAAGTYTVTSGYREWWSGPRHMRVSVVAPDGETTVITERLTVRSGGSVADRTRMSSGVVTIEQDGVAEFRVEVAEGSEAPVIGWLAVAAGEVDVDVAPLVVARPSVLPGGGTYASPQTVELATTTDGAAVYYTTDGTTPSVLNGTRYTGPFTLSSTATVRAVAVVDGVASDPLSARFTIAPVPDGGYQNVPVGQPWFDTDGNSIQAHGGGFLEHGGWYYWVGENKIHDSAVFRSVNLYRSQDLKNWEFVNEILTPESSPELEDAKVERPKLVYNEATDTFVLWGHWETADSYSASHLMVATSDEIGGDYTFVRHYRPGVGEVSTEHADPTYTGHDGMWGYGSRDFTVFKDPDSSAAYLVSAEDHENMRVYPLTDDYTDVDWRNSYQLFQGAHREAPAVVKAGDVYLAITSGQSGWHPNQSYYATTSDISDPDGWSDLRPLGNNTTFYSQPTNIMLLEGEDGEHEYIYMGDRWNRHALGSSTYVWLPLEVDGEDVSLAWRPEWNFDTDAGTVSYPDVVLVSERRPVQAPEASQDYPASAANDGVDVNVNRVGDSSNYYLPPSVPFSWTVDLEDQHDLDRIDVAFRSYNGSETYSEFTVSGSADGQEWVQLVDRSANREVGFASDPLSGKYRYVRVDVSNVVNDHNGNAAAWAAGLVEVQVYADVEAPDPTEPDQPGEPGEPGDPTVPGEPTEPGDPTEPGEPGEPSEPTDPADPGEPTDPAGPADTAEPTAPVDGADGERLPSTGAGAALLVVAGTALLLGIFALMVRRHSLPTQR